MMVTHSKESNFELEHGKLVTQKKELINSRMISSTDDRMGAMAVETCISWLVGDWEAR